MRDYAWGSQTALSEVFGWAPSAHPQAEVWMGSHPAAPSQLITEDGEHQQIPELPYLLKVLAAEKPLSIQAHPSKAQAQSGYAAEEAAGVAIGAGERNYKDTNHKPELTVALTPFSMLCGFREPAQIMADLNAVQRLIAEGDLALAIESLSVDILREDYSAALETALRDSTGLLTVAAEELTSRNLNNLEPQLADTLSRVTSGFPGDPGLFVALMLNRIDLEPGEGVYVPAGVLHAYLHGVAVELQATSDNVLRGGLTPKHIDIPELLKVTTTEVISDPRLAPEQPSGELTGGRHLCYAPDSEDFELHNFEVQTEELSAGWELTAPTILLATAGKLTISGRITLTPGESAFIPAGTRLTLTAETPDQGAAQAYLATTPGALRTDHEKGAL
ncbi:mannose-6-phosphate isomerase, class I [Nesterenkonia sedimenti]|uniref:mannose-6-phosphate isomerase, class I n=1 Tax=Nesterenkonia sedimenti TaxID=1463632 RepID=UPI001B3B2777